MPSRHWFVAPGCDEKIELQATYSISPLSQDYSQRAAQAYQAGQIALAEGLARQVLELDPHNALVRNLLGAIALKLGALDMAAEYFQQAALADPQLRPLVDRNLEVVRRCPSQGAANAPETGTGAPCLVPTERGPRNIGEPVPVSGQPPKSRTDSPRFLLIRGWGYGFWSDIDHVLVQLLLAEATNRAPVVHWGGESKFSDDRARDAFGEFFPPVSPDTIDDLVGRGYDFFPPKWNDSNLRGAEVHKWSGPYSRMGAIYYLRRPERVAVADFYTALPGLLPWIGPGHPLHGAPIAAGYRYLTRKYLHPGEAIRQKVDQFASEHFGSGPVIGIHVRGSDKILENPALPMIHRAYFPAIEAMLERYPGARLFLLTDSEPVRAEYQSRYGERLITTACRRTSSGVGTHNLEQKDRRGLGIEVATDAYLALRCRAFIGCASSAVSCMIAQMKDWPSCDCVLLGGANFLHQPKWNLYEPPADRLHSPFEPAARRASAVSRAGRMAVLADAMDRWGWRRLAVQAAERGLAALEEDEPVATRMSSERLDTKVSSPQATATVSSPQALGVPSALLDAWQAPSLPGLLLRQCLALGCHSTYGAADPNRIIDWLGRLAHLETNHPEPLLRRGLLTAHLAAVQNRPIPEKALADLRRAAELSADPRAPAALRLAQGMLDDIVLPYDGAMIYLAPSLANITTYVLLEQGDWFEAELHLFRQLVQPGDRVLDLGANVGVYTLSAARRVGPHGRVMAIEPARTTFDRLARSCGTMESVCLRRAAASDSSRRECLIGGQPELLELGTGHEGGEMVEVHRVDDLAREAGFSSFEIIKMDVEGHEEAVLRGARRVLDSGDPIIFYEVLAGSRLNLGLVEVFRKLGFDSYVYCRSGQWLRPFDPAERDPYLLNLIAARPTALDRLRDGVALRHTSVTGRSAA